jgi:hypothetical protein
MVVVIPPLTKIYLVFPWGVGNLEEIKHVFHVFQINHESTTLQCGILLKIEHTYTHINISFPIDHRLHNKLGP